MNNRIVVDISSTRASVGLPPGMTAMEGVEKLLAAAHFLTMRAMKKQTTPNGLIVPGGVSNRQMNAMRN